MGIFRRMGNGIGLFFDWRADRWLGYGYMKDSLSRTKRMASDVVHPDQATRQETFEQAMERLQMTEADVLRQQTAFERLFAIFTVLALGILAYGIGMFFLKGYLATIVSIPMSGFAFALAFRYHFWYFQLKQRRLGCTISEWYEATFGGRKKL